MRRFVTTLTAGGLLVALAGLSCAALVVLRQGAPDGFWDSCPWAKVRFDDVGIPTIEAETWPKVVFAQGYVVASERLWQMDLLRRKAAGRLAEWAGNEAFLHDVGQLLEDRGGVAERAAAALPPRERDYCEAYADGVNEFIAQNPRRWGVEYLLLGERPEPWSCADSMLVLLTLAEQLTSSSEQEAQAEVWRRNLSPAWESFLFTDDHPWNRPMFGAPAAAGPAFPPPAEHLPRQPLQPRASTAANYVKSPPVGSNSWAWSGRTGAYLANDPHLSHTVPSVWYALRLRVRRDDWLVGAAVPGVPGIIIGMNPTLAWAFTNTGEDVDDLLEEQLSPEGHEYLAAVGADGREQWRPVIHKMLSLQVRGDPTPRRIMARATHRGPLSQHSRLNSGTIFSRQWLPLKEGALRLPIIGLVRSLEEFDRALDSMRVPSQNVLVVTRDGDIGYRASGTGVLRRTAGHRPLPALTGEWQGLAPPEERPRRYLRGEGKSPRHLATANQRIWTGGYGHLWESDDRQERLQEVLAARDDFSQEDMERLQLDTQARFRKLLLDWIASRAATVETAAARATTGRWHAWDGASRSDPRAFAQAERAEELLTRLLLERIQQRFPEDDRKTPYHWPLQRAWLTAVLEAPRDEGLAPFGLAAGEVARHLLATLVAEEPRLPDYPTRNRWQAQHPFVAAIPVLGQLFAVDEHPQWGADDVVSAEAPFYGASMRLVWNLTRPWESSWSFPVGQSGHIGSRHYKDMQKAWFAGERLKVFDDGWDWGFPGRRESH